MKSTWPWQSRRPIPYIFPIRTTVRIGQRTKTIGSPRTRKLRKFFLFSLKKKTKKFPRWRKTVSCPNRQNERQGLWERVHQAKRPRRPSMRMGNLWVRSLRSHELVRTSLRNQTGRRNISSVKWRADGWRRMVLISRSGGVTFLLSKMIHGISEEDGVQGGR